MSNRQTDLLAPKALNHRGFATGWVSLLLDIPSTRECCAVLPKRCFVHRSSPIFAIPQDSSRQNPLCPRSDHYQQQRWVKKLNPAAVGCFVLVLCLDPSALCPWPGAEKWEISWGNDCPPAVCWWSPWGGFQGALPTTRERQTGPLYWVR